MGFSVLKPQIHSPALPRTRADLFSLPKALNKFQDSRWNTSWSQSEGKRGRGTSSWKIHAFPDWPLMAIMTEHVPYSRDYVVHKSAWHLNDETMKNVYTMYIMFTCWGCCFFGSTKDPFYDGEEYRKEGGDGSVHWYYDKQEEIEAAARAELWREELIEEIEQKVGGLRELEEAGKEEELVQ
ncbi:photosynthetic NDH subunit of subcomplex B 4, chloroplastic isoform X1 [Phoenix dactylifera]|uniref:Photosynthetic NDH subunit of subcomplex B 4, chloroplastic isoform X1 n=1 Tax=Phoenix dactylifera TaxID=42345 RepID=A0A8B7BR45_PHODC|nr:photosynthetic NDH subunit of subcomplex B 4, chloroplastic isoform X1 [Phoenix dactylifera]